MIIVLCTDGYLYSITFNGCKRFQKAEGISKRKLIKKQISFAKKSKSDIAYTKKIFNSYQTDEIHKIGFTFTAAHSVADVCGICL